MNKLSTFLLATGMLALSACGGAGEANVADNSAENLAVPADDLSLPADANSVDASGDLSVDTNLDAGANLGSDLNVSATDNSALNGL